MLLWKIGSHCKTCLSGHLIRKMREQGHYIPAPVTNWLNVAFRKYLFLGNSGLQYAQTAGAEGREIFLLRIDTDLGN